MRWAGDSKVRELKLQSRHEQRQGDGKNNDGRKGAGGGQIGDRLDRIGTAQRGPVPVVGVGKGESDSKGEEDADRNVSKHVHGGVPKFQGLI